MQCCYSRNMNHAMLVSQIGVMTFIESWSSHYFVNKMKNLILCHLIHFSDVKVVVTAIRVGYLQGLGLILI